MRSTRGLPPRHGPADIGKHRHDADPLRVAVVGYGYWGPNLVRNVMERPELELAGLCERDPARARAFTPEPPGSRAGRPRRRPARRAIDAVIVATPPRTHHAIVARRSRPASTCWSRSRWPRRPRTPST